MKKYKTMSDMGSVLIGNDKFQVAIPNGVGDGMTKLLIFEEGEFNAYNKKFFTSFQGKNIKVYAYDCEPTDVVALISGRYGAYYSDGTVYFERWRD